MVSAVKKIFKQNRALKTVGTYTAIKFFAKGVSFLLVLVYTQPRFMSPEDNGLVNLFSSSILFLMPFLSLGTVQSTGTEYFRLKKEDFQNFFTSIVALSLFTVMVSVVGFFLAKEYLKSNYGFPYAFVLLIPLATYSTYIYELICVVLRSENDLKRFSRVGLTKIILELGLSVVLVVFFAMHWKGRVAGILISGIVITGYAFFFLYNRGFFSGRISSRILRSEMLYAIPVAVMQFSIFCLGSSEKFFLSYFYESNAVVGIYGVAIALATVVNLFSVAYTGYLFPSIYRNLSGEKKDYGKIKKNFLQYVGVLAAVTVGLIVISHFLFEYVINEKYRGALEYLYLLVIGYFLWSMASFFYSFLFYFKEKKKLFFLSLFLIVSTLLINFLMTKNFGVKGTAAGVLMNYAITLGLVLWVCKKYVRLIFNSGQIKG